MRCSVKVQVQRHYEWLEGPSEVMQIDHKWQTKWTEAFTAAEASAPSTSNYHIIRTLLLNYWLHFRAQDSAES